jgi:fibronectin-binding autotransporter adhesin
MTRHLLKFAATAFTCCALLIVYSASVVAADRIWDGGGANDSWSTPANWDGDLTAPVGSDTLTFDGSLRLAPTNNLTADTIFTQLTFAPTAGSFTLGGNEITLGGNIVNSSPNAQIVNLPLLLNGNRTVSVDTGGQLTLGGVISGATFGITKSGAGTLTLGAANTYTGNTTLDGGTLAYTANNTTIQALNFGPVASATAVASVNASTLDLTNANLTATSLNVNSNSSTPNSIIIGAGKTLTVNGAFTVGPAVAFNETVSGVVTNLNISGNSLVVNGGTTAFAIVQGRSNAATGTDPIATVDMSANGGLNNFTYTGTGTGTAGEFRVGSGNARGTLTLANVSNTITAPQVRVGDSSVGGTGDNNAGRSTLHLGAGTNVISTSSIVIGNGKSGGTIDFAAAATNGTVTIAGITGGASTTPISVGTSSSATGSNDESQLFLAGHNATVQGSTVIVGRLANGTAGNSARGNITFDTGTFNATSLQIAVNSSGSAANGATGVFTLGGPSPDNTAATGILNVTAQFLLGNRTNTNPAAGKSTATFTINGGTANIGADILDASTTVSNTGANVSTLTLAGGTLNMSNHNIGSAAAPITNVNLNSGTLNSPGLISGSTINILPQVVISGTPSFAIGNGGTLNSFSSPITLGTGATLSGGGPGGATVNGDVIANSGSKVLPGNSTTASTLNLNNNLTLNSGSGVKFKLSENQGSGNDQINVSSGALNLSGTVNVEIGIAGIGPQIGNTYTLFNYAALNGNQSNFNVIGPGSRTTFTILPTNTTPGTIQLSVGGSGPLALTWRGNVNSTWDLNTTANWQNPSLASDKFFQLDSVTFDNTSTNLSDVSIVGQLSPGGVSVSATRNYKFVGTGGIAGGGNLTKSNTGTLILATNNTYTGTTDIQGGTLQIGDGGTTGSLGLGAVSNEGVLVFNRSDLATVTVPNVISGGLGTVVQNGSGTLMLTGSNTYAGGLTINNGTVRTNVVGAPGTGVTTINAGGTLVVGAAHINAITIAGGAIGSSFGTTATSFTSSDFTAAASTTSTVYTADPQFPATNGEMVLTGTLRGSGNLNVLSGSNATSPDANRGFRLRGQAPSDYSGTITLGHNVKGEIQTSVVGNFSPAGTGKFVLTAGDAALNGTQNAATTTNGYSEFNVRNNSTGNNTFGNDVEITGTGLALMNALGTAPVNSVTTMGNLKIGGGQELGVFLNTAATPPPAHVIEFPTVTLNGGIATFSPKTPGFGPANSVGSDIALGNVSQLVAGSGLTMSGLRTLFINGTTSYTGPTTVNSGFLGGTGTINSTVTVNPTGALAPGSVSSPIGTLTTSAVNLGGSLRIDLDDSAVGVQDVLNVNGALALSGATLNLNINGVLTQPAYIIAHYGSVSGGTFSSFVGTPGYYKVDYNYLGGHQIALVPAAALVQGDWDRNGVTNSADIKAMLKALTDLNAYKAQNSLSDTNLLTIGDINVSGAVNNQDIQPMLDLIAGLGGGSVAAVPEPASMALGGIGFAALVFVARRKKLAA